MKKIYLIFPILTIVLSGCIKINTGGTASKNINLGGIYKTIDKGENWKNISVLATAGGKASDFSSLNIASISIDPSDSRAIYYGSVDNGLLYSYDAGASWQLARELGQGTIESVAIDSKDKCNIYIARKNKIFKSNDCNRSWKQMYQDNDIGSVVSGVAVDPYDNNIVYAYISRGDLIRSKDGGNAWQVVKRFDNRIAKMIINRKNSREIFVATYQKGIFKTTDSGANWTRLAEVDKALKDNDMKYELRDFLVIDGEKSRTLFLATFYGMLRSVDNGVTWTKLDLIAPKEKASINAMVVNPGNIEEIYYTTNSTFYKSVDGGKTWKTIPLPTSRIAWRLLIDEKDPKVIYLGVIEPKK